MKRKILCNWMGNATRVLYVEEELEDGTLSCTDITMRDYFRVDEDGDVVDDRGNGDWLGVVIDWDYEGSE